MTETTTHQTEYVIDPAANGTDEAAKELARAAYEMDARLITLDAEQQDHRTVPEKFPPVTVTVRNAQLLYADPVHGIDAIETLKRIIKNGRHVAVVAELLDGDIDYPARSVSEAIAEAPRLAIELVNAAIKVIDPGPEKVQAVLASSVTVDWGEGNSGSSRVSDSREDKMSMIRTGVRTRLTLPVLAKMPEDVLLAADDGAVVRLLGGGPAGKILTGPFGTLDAALWNGPGLAPATGTYPLSYADGARARFRLWTREGAAGSIVTGPPASGKSEWVRLHMMECMRSRMITVWYGNIEALGGDPEPGEYADWYADDGEKITDMLRSAADVAADRLKRIERTRARMWEVSQKAPMLRVVIPNADLLLTGPHSRQASRTIGWLRDAGRVTGIGVDLVAARAGRNLGTAENIIRLHKQGICTPCGSDSPVRIVLVEDDPAVTAAAASLQAPLDRMSAKAAGAAYRNRRQAGGR